MRRAVSLVLVAAAALLGCSGGDGDARPGPTSTGVPTSTTVPIDYSKVTLPPVPGETTIPVDDGPGDASLGGRVMGPEGAVAGAVVRVQRLTSAGEITRDVLTATDGSWRLDAIKGGRYRVRAWRVPDLFAAPAVFFLEGDDRRELAITVERKGGTVVASAIAPSPPRVGARANLVATVSTRVVDDQGIVRSTPIAGQQVDLVGSGAWRLFTPGPRFTDGRGTAQWEIVCTAAGSQPLSVLVNAETHPLDLPACVDETVITSPPTTSGAGATTTAPRATTTSSVPTADQSTQETRKPKD